MRTAVQQLTLVLRIIFRSASFAWLLTTLTIAKSSYAQGNAPAPAISEPAVDPDAAELDGQADVQTSENAMLSVADQEPAPTIGNDSEQPPVTDLSTGLPLRILLTPFHWGRFSLLSVTSYGGYNSNPDFQSNPIGAWVTSVSTLAMFSSQFSGWRLNLQYQPFVWFSSNRTVTDFAAASADIRTLRHINEKWHWTLGDRLRYSPTHSSEQSKGFIYDPGGGFSIGNAFLSSGRNILLNGIYGTLTDRYSDQSTLIFHANQDYTHLSSFVGSESNSQPAQSATTFAAGLTWRNHVSFNDTLSAEFNFRNQITSGTSVANVNSITAGVGWSHKLTRSIGASATIGPAWSFYSGQQDTNNSSRGKTTVHGSVSLSKEFRKGGMVVSFARSNSFSGIISDSFHNRYDFTVHREFNTRFNCSATASYIQQQFSNATNTNGELITVEARYFLTKDWAVFGQARYLDIYGNEPVVAPEKGAVVGVRWAWVPEKP